jgi:hypothetical protein
MTAPLTLIVMAALMTAVSGCTDMPLSSTSPIQAMGKMEYAALLNKYTHKTNQYSGLYQTFQADVTILNSEVQSALVRQRASFQGWDEKQFQMEREKSIQEASAYSKFFLRFFAGDRDYDDLNKPKTIWKVYLDFNGSRFEGKIKKLPEKNVELSALFPNMDHFSTGYEITFSLPMTTLETGTSKITLTSSLGTAQFVFPPK